jgi:hypothetical protein
MKPVEIEFIHRIQEKEAEAGNADGQAQNINQGQAFLFQQIPDRDFEILFYHALNFKQ